KAGGHVLNRFSPNNLPIVDESGKRVDLAPKLRHLKPGETSEFVYSFDHEGERHELRICAIRKSEEAAEREREKIRRRARKYGYKTVKASSLEYAAYTLVATTLPADIGVMEILAIYRARWQIELL